MAVVFDGPLIFRVQERYALPIKSIQILDTSIHVQLTSASAASTLVVDAYYDLNGAFLYDQTTS